jgi:lysozyme family protein
MTDKLAIAHFDTIVNTGITQGAKFLQRCLNVKDDGIVGPGTLAALAASDQNSLIPGYLDQRRFFYQKIVLVNPKLQEFLKGWLNRVNDLEEIIFYNG